ncbi:MAG TPA: peptide chain release factor N(5)-glutamine methyltransferase, partial [Flavitalea sp.]|nr:peptide chain release factor N(5)-glutamine methyltransferase [Flavitalea sp.]
EKFSSELMTGKPVQYVLGEGWFLGMKFFVNHSVLIPRPETEELVQWVINDYDQPTRNEQRRILDIGTGSGCIAIALKKKFLLAEVYACDISKDAIIIAQKNAATLAADINFSVLDILDVNAQNHLGIFDVVISNPPYISFEERSSLPENVINFEPAVALFVEKNPLLFYRTIITFCLDHLSQSGALYFEVHEAHGREVLHLMESAGFVDCVLKKDMQGKERMVKGSRQYAVGSML